MLQQILLGLGGSAVVTAPVYLSVTATGFFGSATTSHLVAMPAVVNAGDLLLAHVAMDGTANPITPSGWTVVPSTNMATGSARNVWYRKTAVGTEGGTTVNFATAGVENGAAHVFRIQAGTWSTVEIFSSTEGNSTTPTPPTATPTAGLQPYLFIAACMMDNRLNAFTSWPYTNGRLQTEVGSSGSQYASIGTSYRTATTSSESPGAYTINIARGWMAYTVAIGP